VLVGSCYCVANDRDARLARAAALLAREGASPDVKFLCGDQVYIDTPPNYAWAPRERAELLDKFLGDYIDTWSERGLLPLLRQGATYFTSDDHEFWNEYPAMRGQGGRTPTRESLARGLFEVFQRREDPEPTPRRGSARRRSARPPRRRTRPRRGARRSRRGSQGRTAAAR